MRLFIANPTIQNKIFFYRMDYIAPGVLVPERMRMPKRQVIARGHQEALGNKSDFTPDQVADIIGQLQRYGAVEAKEVTSAGNLIDFIYSVDTPVPQKLIEHAVEHNKGIKFYAGKEIRKQAAVAANDVLLNKIIDASIEGDAAPPEEAPPFAVSFEQVDNDSDEPSMEGEGIRIDAAALRGPGRPRKNAA